MARAQTTEGGPNALGHAGAGTRLALWWLRHYDRIVHFWIGFSWVWVMGILLYAVVGYFHLKQALLLILLIGVILNTGGYCVVKTLSSYLKHMQDGPAKEEAHDLMVKIIRKRIPVAR
jgi:uncharacterized membrane protein HdeD (DUF308 family)